MVFFVDEVGDNTSQKDDGNVGGQKFVAENNAHALICSSYADSHFTILEFTKACGDAICCVIILAIYEVEAKNIMGFQPWVSNTNGNPTINIKGNCHGLDKYYPLGPTCTYDEKEIAMYVTCSEFGSITSKILRDIVKHLDSNLNFNHSKCMPFLLLDGHGTCFEFPFLKYMKMKEPSGQ